MNQKAVYFILSSNFLIYFGNFLAVSSTSTQQTMMTHFFYVFMPFFILSVISIFYIVLFMLMITAMVENMTNKIKRASNESIIRKIIDIYHHLQRTLNYPVFVMFANG